MAAETRLDDETRERTKSALKSGDLTTIPRIVLDDRADTTSSQNIYISIIFFYSLERWERERTSLALQAYVGAVDNSVTLPCAVRVICPTTNRREAIVSEK